MVSCADDCWRDDGVTAQNSSSGNATTGRTGRMGRMASMVEVSEVEGDEDWTQIQKNGDQEDEKSDEKSDEKIDARIDERSDEGSGSFQWPTPAKSRSVSEETVDAVIELITGSQRMNDPLTGGGDYILLPEGYVKCKLCPIFI